MIVSALELALPAGTLTARERSPADEDDDGSVFEILYQRPDHPQQCRHGVEAMFAIIVALARQATGVDIAATASFAWSPPPHAGPFEAFYWSVSFGAAQDKLCFPIHTLDIPMLGSEPELARMVASRAEELLAIHGLEALAVRACREVATDGNASLAQTAKRLGMSARSLQRRLADEGSSYRKVRESVLREAAERLLRDPTRSVDDIADTLGYSRRPSFERAFRRWTGATPASWRREKARAK